ncbi:MAG: Pvc16 family protein [Nitrospirota bacterium]
MLNLLDELLRKVLIKNVTGLQPVIPGQPAAAIVSDQVRFEPPDDAWLSAVGLLQRNALSVYLVDLRENRKLRSNERTQERNNGIVFEQPAPARLDCHYLISAFSPTAQLTPQVEPALDEHALLYEVAAVLLREGTLNPSRVYPQTANPWPTRFQNVDLSMVVAPVEGFPKLAEFWGTMGTKHPWRPVLYLIVTIPVALIKEQAGYMVTTRITEYRQTNKPDTAEVWIQIGGHVRQQTTPLADAWVGLETLAGQIVHSTNTNELGRYTFENLQPGQYKLKSRAVGFPEKERSPIDVPSTTGEYDLTYP